MRRKNKRDKDKKRQDKGTRRGRRRQRLGGKKTHQEIATGIQFNYFSRPRPDS